MCRPLDMFYRSALRALFALLTKSNGVLFCCRCQNFFSPRISVCFLHQKSSYLPSPESPTSLPPKNLYPYTTLLSHTTMSTSSLSSEGPAQPIYVDIAEAPGALLSPDAPNQIDVLLHHHDDSEDIDELRTEANRFLDRSVITKNLDRIRRIYDQKQAATSQDLLAHRVK